jgi:hypothetical protein
LWREEEETYKMGIYAGVDLLYPGGEVALFRSKGIGELGLANRG